MSTATTNSAMRNASAKQIGGSAMRGGGEFGIRSDYSTRHGGEVFCINFIRGETFSRRTRSRLAWVVVGYLVANAIVLCVLICSALATHAQTRRLTARLHQQLPASLEPAQIQQELDALYERANGELAALTAMLTHQRERFVTGSKLAALTKTLPPRTWITDLAADRKNAVISWQATYLINPEAPRELPMKGWVEALKADLAFSHGLKRLDVGATSRKRQGPAEVLSFDMTAQWRAAGGSKRRSLDSHHGLGLSARSGFRPTGEEEGTAGSARGAP